MEAGLGAKHICRNWETPMQVGGGDAALSELRGAGADARAGGGRGVHADGGLQGTMGVRPSLQGAAHPLPVLPAVLTPKGTCIADGSTVAGPSWEKTKQQLAPFACCLQPASGCSCAGKHCWCSGVLLLLGSCCVSSEKVKQWTCFGVWGSTKAHGERPIVIRARDEFMASVLPEGVVERSDSEAGGGASWHTGAAVLA